MADGGLAVPPSSHPAAQGHCGRGGPGDPVCQTTLPREASRRDLAAGCVWRETLALAEAESATAGRTGGCWGHPQHPQGLAFGEERGHPATPQ